MIGDKRIVKSIHKFKAYKLLKKIIEWHFLSIETTGNFSEKSIILIGGEAGTGKTEIADILQENLWEQYNISVKIIHMDDYYNTTFRDRNKIREEQGMSVVGIKEIDWKGIQKIIGDFFGYVNKLCIKRINKYTNSVEYVIANNNCIDIIIIEGLYACRIAEDYTCVSVYLEGNVGETYSYRLERGKENPDDKFRQQVLEREAKAVARTKKYATVLVTYDGEIK